LPKGVNLILEKELNKLKLQHTLSSHQGKRTYSLASSNRATIIKNTKYPFHTMEVGEVWSGPTSSINNIRNKLARIKANYNKLFTTRKENSTFFVTRIS